MPGHPPRPAAAVSSLVAAAALAALVTAAAPRRVLVVSETAGFRHESIAAAQALLRRLDRQDSSYAVRFLAAAGDLTPRRLRRAHAVVFLNTSGELALAPEGRAALLDFVRGGKGFLGTHSASDTFHAWPEYLEMLGGEFVAHPFTRPGRVVVEDPRHPAARRLPAAFDINEEFYFFRTNPRARAHVIARLDVASVGGDGSEDRPLVWCRREGKGRVFYDALGHFRETWEDARQRKLVAGGLAWVLGLSRRAPCR